jgi:hypothetical protein
MSTRRRQLCSYCGAWFPLDEVHVCEPEQVEIYKRFKPVERPVHLVPNQQYEKPNTVPRLNPSEQQTAWKKLRDKIRKGEICQPVQE